MTVAVSTKAIEIRTTVLAVVAKSMTKHTEGEWISTEDGAQVICIDDMGASTICDMNVGLIDFKDNAALIAAAPELLQWATLFVAAIEQGRNINTQQSALDELKKAISKAEGSK